MVVSQTGSSTVSRDGSSGVRRRGSSAVLWLAVIVLLAWQILMTPRLIMDARWLGPQASTGWFPIERLTVSITGTVAYGVHVLIWLAVSIFLGSVVVLAAVGRSRKGG